MLFVSFSYVNVSKALALTDGEWEYIVSLADNTAEITKYVGVGGNVVVPSTLTGYSITNVHQSTFRNNASVTGVTIPDNMRMLNNGAYYFQNCTALTSVALPNYITKLGDYIFEGCTSLTSYTIPRNITGIGWSAFAGCTSLSTITFPDWITSIDAEAFVGCTSLTSIVIPDGCDLSRNAFNNCTSLKSVTFNGDGIHHGFIDITSTRYFDGCESLTSVILHEKGYNPRDGYGGYGYTHPFPNVTYYIYKGTYFHEVLLNMGLKFVLLDDNPPPPTPQPIASTPSSTPTQSPQSAGMSSGINVLIDGSPLAFDVPPQMINGRTMVPLRVIFEAMGAGIEWNSSTQTVTATKDGTVVILTVGNTSPKVNGKAVSIDQPGIIVDGRTLAPLRFVAEAFGGSVNWVAAENTAYITK